MKPNLFIIGAMKAGTTYLYELLKRHPSIFMCEPKEPCYFVEPERLRKLYPQAWRRRYWQAEADYLALFRNAGAATYVGEASVFYAFHPRAPGVAERIKRFRPDARLIYVLRDPVERTISHYWHNVRYFGEYRSADVAIKPSSDYALVSNYQMQLREYFAHFDRSQIKVLTFEELVSRPEETMPRVFDWLGLGSPATERIAPQNVTPDRFGRPAGPLRRMFQQSELLRAAMQRLPVKVQRLGESMATREVIPASVDMSKVVDRLRPVQREETKALSILLGREFPEWALLHSSGAPKAP